MPRSYGAAPDIYCAVRTSLATVRLDELQGTVHVRRGLGVESDERCTGVREVSHDAVNGGHHQVHVNRFGHTVVPEPLAHKRANRQVRHEVVVHDVKVNNICPRRHCVVYLLSELGHVRREDGRGNPEVLLVVRVVRGRHAQGRGLSYASGAGYGGHGCHERLAYTSACSTYHRDRRCLSHHGYVCQVVTTR